MLEVSWDIMDWLYLDISACEAFISIFSKVLVLHHLHLQKLKFAM